MKEYINEDRTPFSKEQFIERIKTDEKFSKRFGNLGPIYGKQWRSWGGKKITSINLEKVKPYRWGMIMDMVKNGDDVSEYGVTTETKDNSIDQIANSINLLKTDPDSRRNKVSAWNVGELEEMTLPPCHTDFQFYTRELSRQERSDYYYKHGNSEGIVEGSLDLPIWVNDETAHKWYDKRNVPTRAISLMFNQRSVDTFLGLPFNIASYGLLLTMIADEVNMVPDELIGNLGDVHLYSNHIEQAKEQIGRELSLDERRKLWESTGMGWKEEVSELLQMQEYNCRFIPKRTREPYPLPTVHVRDGIFCSSSNDVLLENYQSHPTIKAPLSN